MTDHSLAERIAKLETLYEHLDEKLDEIKAAQFQQAASTRRLEDVVTKVGAWRIAFFAFIPALSALLGAKYQAILSALGFK